MLIHYMAEVKTGSGKDEPPTSRVQGPKSGSQKPASKKRKSTTTGDENVKKGGGEGGARKRKRNRKDDDDGDGKIYRKFQKQDEKFSNKEAMWMLNLHPEGSLINRLFAE